MATLLDRINHKRKARIITIEDPVEYLHTPILGVVDQRQVGIDAPSFNDALVSALRQDPDVIFVGESRDRNTIRTAITAAETGHLVFTTAHSGDAVGAIERLVMPVHRRGAAERAPATGDGAPRRRRAAPAPRGRLRCRRRGRPQADGRRRPKRRVAACEILVNTPAIAHCIATAQGRQIISFMESGRAFGMQKLEHDVARLLAAQKIYLGDGGDGQPEAKLERACVRHSTRIFHRACPPDSAAGFARRIRGKELVMAKVLVVYCSLSGNTKAAAEAVAEGARAAGAEVALKPAEEAQRRTC